WASARAAAIRSWWAAGAATSPPASCSMAARSNATGKPPRCSPARWARCCASFARRRSSCSASATTPSRSTMSAACAMRSRKRAALVSASIGAPALAQAPDVVPAAKKEGEVMLYTSLVPEDLTPLGAAFEKKYGVKLKTWRANSEKVLQRAVTEMRAGRSDADVVETNGPQMESLYREKGLQPLKSQHLKDLMPQALQPHGHWVGTRINMFVQSYNTKLVKQEELPKSYSDLTNPRWKGRLGIEAEDEDWFAMVLKEMGEEAGLRTFREIARGDGFSVRRGQTSTARTGASGQVTRASTNYR